MKSSGRSAPEQNKASTLSVFTLVVWLGCLLVGGLGFALPYTRPHPPGPFPEAVKVEIFDVSLANQPQPVTQRPPDTEIAMPNAPAQPDIPQPTPVAEPSPAIAFALPVEGPVRIVAAQRAAYTPSPPVSATPSAPAPQVLTFGQGEGRQPKPDYPDRARREGQEGTVAVRFTVNQDGRVIAAEIVTPSPWLLLNDAALNAVRDRWRLSAGKLRVYDVAIRFELAR